MSKILDRLDYEDIERYRKILPHLKRIEKEKKIYLEDLINELISLGFAENEEEAKRLAEELDQLSLIVIGLDENFKKTWHRTVKTIENLELIVRLNHLKKEKNKK
ncbi:hypothetical protein [Hydrogenothermus marinus]|uniref:Uncharacterized protein n=1 Tax=Hydrogenothermus marinus TaxID=133270 RepID=A0A3M0BR89_9AQUI|nr:hypothetical protein [Hydrogenothermus marinus]RMB00051.1 hypothetical protein CLV39_0064 [Hydrogenothermus marinus]